jgi:hypothetical protein
VLEQAIILSAEDSKNDQDTNIDKLKISVDDRIRKTFEFLKKST